MSDLDSTRVEEALLLLGEMLDYESVTPVHLIVVGGSALLAAGIVSRTTYDVDVFARRAEVDGGILDARPLPEPVQLAAKHVANELRLRPNWLNTGPTWVAAPLGSYPPEFWSEMVVREYGKSLSITYIGRAGLIYLKFHAAVDLSRKRHEVDVDDLRLLKPSREEAEKVLRWMRDEELIHAGNAEVLEELLTTLGYEDLVS